MFGLISTKRCYWQSHFLSFSSDCCIYPYLCYLSANY